MRTVFFLLIGIVLAGCAPKHGPVPQRLSDASVAECVASTLSLTELAQMGASVQDSQAGQVVALRRFDQLGCRGFRGIFANDQTLRTQAAAITQKLLPRPEFRQGLQQMLWRQRGVAPEVASQLTTLTMATGRHAVERAWAQGCGVLTEGDSGMLRDLEPVFVTAVIGTHGWADSVPAAQSLGLEVMEQSKAHALADAQLAKAACTSPVMRDALRAQQQGLLAFTRGKNDAAPGCKADAQGSEYILRCTAP